MNVSYTWFPPSIHETKATSQLWLRGWLLFTWSKGLFAMYVLASNREITVHALLPWRPPIVDWDRKAGSSQKVSLSAVEGGTWSVEGCDDKGTCELADGGCTDDCVVCCEDWLRDRSRLGHVIREPWDLRWPGCPQSEKWFCLEWGVLLAVCLLSCAGAAVWGTLGCGITNCSRLLLTIFSQSCDL